MLAHFSHHLEASHDCYSAGDCIIVLASATHDDSGTIIGTIAFLRSRCFFRGVTWLLVPVMASVSALASCETSTLMLGLVPITVVWHAYNISSTWHIQWSHWQCSWHHMTGKNLLIFLACTYHTIPHRLTCTIVKTECSAVNIK